jgi:hypothetical protein
VLEHALGLHTLKHFRAAAGIFFRIQFLDRLYRHEDSLPLSEMEEQRGGTQHAILEDR